MSRRRPMAQYDTGKRCWVMVGATFMSAFLIMGNLKALGVLLNAIIEDLDSEVWIVGWIAVAFTMVQNFCGPLAACIARLVGYRKTIIFGGVMTSSGFILASFATNSVELALCYVGLGGIGGACCWYNIFAVMSSYFNEKYSLAVSIAMIGNSMGLMVYGPLSQVFLSTYQWRGASLLLGGLVFHLVPCGAMVLRDPSNTDPNGYKAAKATDADHGEDNELGENDELDEGCFHRFCTAMDFAVLADARFLLLAGAKSCCEYCYTAWVVFIVPYARFQGLSDLQVSFLPFVYGLGNVFGKLTAPVVGLLGFSVSRPIWACGSSIVLCAFFFASPFSQSFAGQMVVAGGTGYGFGLIHQVIHVMTRFLCTDDRLVSVLGWQALFNGVAGLTGGLLAGWVYEWTGSFQGTFYMYGGVMLASIPMYVIYDVCTRRQQERNTNQRN